jgi:hypothetical protein
VEGCVVKETREDGWVKGSGVWRVVIAAAAAGGCRGGDGYGLRVTGRGWMCSRLSGRALVYAWAILWAEIAQRIEVGRYFYFHVPLPSVAMLLHARMLRYPPHATCHLLTQRQTSISQPTSLCRRGCEGDCQGDCEGECALPRSATTRPETVAARLERCRLASLIRPRPPPLAAAAPNITAPYMVDAAFQCCLPATIDRRPESIRVLPLSLCSALGPPRASFLQARLPTIASAPC